MNTLGGFIGFIGLLIVFATGMMVGGCIKELDIQRRSIEDGRGYYHPKTGEFTWYESGNCQK